MAAENTLNFTDSAFDQDVLNSDTSRCWWISGLPGAAPARPWAPPSTPSPTSTLGKVKVGKLNTDDNPGTAMRYEIRGIPTLLLFKGGQVVDQRVGAMPKPEVLRNARPAPRRAGLSRYSSSNSSPRPARPSPPISHTSETRPWRISARGLPGLHARGCISSGRNFQVDRVRFSRSMVMMSPSCTAAIGPPTNASGATWPTMNPRVAPLKRPSVSSATSSAKPGAHDRAGHAQHFAHARARRAAPRSGSPPRRRL